MTDTTAKRMNLLLEKNEAHINAKVPNRMREMIRSMSKKLNMSESSYIKLAINNQLQKDLNE
jgi:hypothetical protein